MHSQKYQDTAIAGYGPPGLTEGALMCEGASNLCWKVQETFQLEFLKGCPVYPTQAANREYPLTKYFKDKPSPSTLNISHE